jgi:hypothetical protein
MSLFFNKHLSNELARHQKLLFMVAVESCDEPIDMLIGDAGLSLELLDPNVRY